MKKFRFVAIALAVVAFLGTSIQATANNNAPDAEPTITIQKQENQSFVLNVANLGNKAATISIKNSDETVIYETKVADATAYGNLFKYKSLKKGSYTVTVDMADAEFALPITVKYSGIEVNGTVEKRIKPVLTLANDLLFVDVPNGNHEKVRVLILDDKFEKVYSDKNKVAANFKKSYNLKELPAGDYLIKVKVGDRAYYKNVAIN